MRDENKPPAAPVGEPTRDGLHTPGPWGVLPDGYRVYANPDDPKLFSYVCTTAHNVHERTAQARANARLIASAPDMRAEIDRLRAELSALRADFLAAVAAALEQAASIADTASMWGHRVLSLSISEAIRAIIPADHRAALDSLLAKAKMEAQVELLPLLYEADGMLSLLCERGYIGWGNPYAPTREEVNEVVCKLRRETTRLAAPRSAAGGGK